MTQLAGHGEAWRCDVHGLGGVGACRNRTTDLDSGELFEEVEMEPRAAELAVGHAVHPERFHLAHRPGDGSILDCPLLGSRDGSIGELLARIQHGLGTQQAADLVGSERGIDWAHERTVDQRRRSRCDVVRPRRTRR